MNYCTQFKDIKLTDIPSVGGKNASLGEMLSTLSPLGIQIPDGFALTADAYRLFLQENNFVEPLTQLFNELDTQMLSNLPEIGAQCRALIGSGHLPEEVKKEAMEAYSFLGNKAPLSVAVRSSATAEDLPTASFAGQHDSFLNVEGEKNLLEAILKCYVSLFNNRAIKYRIDNGFEHLKVALSVGVQQMVRSDKGSAGVAFTLDPETGFANVIYLTAAWGLGENVVQGAVNPDEFYLFKPAIAAQQRSIIQHRMGAKENTMVYSVGTERPIINIATPREKRDVFCLSDTDVEKLGEWCYTIEKHYGMPMDIEWAKDGLTGDLFIVQARPETVQTQKKKGNISVKEYKILSQTPPICKGKAVGRSIVSGRVSIVQSLADAGKVQQGDIIVADITNPDWNSLLKKAVSIVTNKGGRTSHASIVARELGIHAVVGTMDATQKLKDGQIITVSCIEGDEGRVYDGQLTWEEKELHFESTVPTQTKPMFILADPDNAFRLSFYPNEGVGLLRMEFIIANAIRIHPMALVRYDTLPDSNEKKSIEAITRHYPDKKKYFIEKLSEAVATVAAAFYPKDVIVRMSDFKTNEYSQLIGGATYEPKEENPMLGFRGASRYYNERYREGFGMECEAIRIVRDEMGLTNVKVMIPFCRTVDEGRKVLEVMKSYGLNRGQNGLEVYVMAEIPSNVILAKEFAKIFDGFSIGSNDLTQLSLGIDRDSSIISSLFDENNEAVKQMLSMVIQSAKQSGTKIGLCGQAPSDYPAFAQFLVNEGINSISFTPDALLKGIENILIAEKALTPPSITLTMNRLQNKVAIVTGAAGGMGESEAKLFAEEGARVLATDIQFDKMQKWVTEAQQSGLSIECISHDVTSEEDWEKVADKALELYGKIDILVNNAGVYPAGATTDNTDKNAWDKIIAINLTGPFLGVKAVVPAMKANGGGTIINVASIAGMVGGNGPAYTASKGGLRLLTKDMAIEYAKDHIRVNSLHPGGVLTPMTDFFTHIPGADELIKNTCPQGRLADPKELAYGALFIASDESSFMTGAELVLDGGLIAR